MALDWTEPINRYISVDAQTGLAVSMHAVDDSCTDLCLLWQDWTGAGSCLLYPPVLQVFLALTGLPAGPLAGPLAGLLAGLAGLAAEDGLAPVLHMLCIYVQIAMGAVVRHHSRFFSCRARPARGFGMRTAVSTGSGLHQRPSVPSNVPSIALHPCTHAPILEPMWPRSNSQYRQI